MGPLRCEHASPTPPRPMNAPKRRYLRGTHRRGRGGFSPPQPGCFEGLLAVEKGTGALDLAVGEVVNVSSLQVDVSGLRTRCDAARSPGGAQSHKGQDPVRADGVQALEAEREVWGSIGDVSEEAPDPIGPLVGSSDLGQRVISWTSSVQQARYPSMSRWLIASTARLTTSTFSCDISRAVSRYSRSPAASSARQLATDAPPIAGGARKERRSIQPPPVKPTDAINDPPDRPSGEPPLQGHGPPLP
jgi:hypothetical protein